MHTLEASTSLPGRLGILGLFLAITLYCAPSLPGQQPRDSAVANVLDSAANLLSTDDLPGLEEAREEFSEALEELEAFIDPDSQNGRYWSSYLELERLREEAQKSRINTRLLNILSAKMRQNYVGLEYPQFVRVRDAIDGLVSAQIFGAQPDNTLKIFEREFSATSTLLGNSTASSADKEMALAKILRFLHQANQASVVGQIRQYAALPNLNISVSENLINRLTTRQLSEPSPVNECILGTRILGRACLSGSLSVDLLPSVQGASIDLVMIGTITSNNRGFNRGVVLNTTGRAPVSARKLIQVTPSSIFAGETRIATELDSQIDSIQHRLRIVRKLAAKQAAKQKRQADAIAKGRLQRKLTAQFDEQVNSQLLTAQTQYENLLRESASRPEYQRLAFPPPQFDFYSTNMSIEASAVQATEFQISASSPCPMPRPMDSAVVEIHQTLVNNAIELLLGARSFTNKELDDFALQVVDEVPAEIQEQVDGDGFEIEFPLRNPVQVFFEEDSIRLRIQLNQLKGKDRVLNRVLIETEYKVQYYDERLHLERVGDISISGGGTVVARSGLRAKLKELFKEKLDTEPLQIIKLLPNAAPAVRDLVNRVRVQDVKLGAGWMQLIAR